MRRHIGVVVTTVLVMGIAFAALAQNPKKQLARRIVWWDDPMIVEQIGLTSEQRTRMSAVFAKYESAIDPRNYNAVTQKPYLEALERGDWKQARTDADQWIESLQGPKRAMVDLKLEVLPILNAEQRTKLIQQYPRVVRRSWSPSPRWTDAPGGHEQGMPARPKPKERRAPSP